MSFWEELGPEEYWVMINTIEEAYLNGVISDFLGHSERGGTVWIPGADEEAIRALIPRFRRVVRDLIDRDLVEIREPCNAIFDEAPELDDHEVDEVLADPGTWVRAHGSVNRMVMLMPTARADRMISR
ncbi:hypothetical protein [Kutzneria sp. 744]|uniref:hypothetical protein n=1 Tax=Kutzneria sp. (strain 744) TaxID=345341 RepID=UPI0003EEBCF9|nr:hypothetical protein [Kutzneria sp. 744]EWM15502.1 hypothetical protein KUTG_05806 [Kutzneria sp. 744]